MIETEIAFDCDAEILDCIFSDDALEAASAMGFGRNPTLMNVSYCFTCVEGAPLP